MRHIMLLGLVILTFACKETSIPKPRGYFRISFPEKEYHQIKNKLPYSFQMASYSDLVELPSKDEQSWVNVVTRQNKADLHLTYEPLNSDLALHIEEARRLVYDHSIKADAIDEKFYTNPERNVHGILYYIEGNAASPMQFFLTDSTKNFIRAAFYIREIPNIDSIKPVIDFFEPDILHLIETFEWK